MLANMLRSQQRSLDLLLAAEQARAARETSTSLGASTEPNIHKVASLASSLLKAMPQSPSIPYGVTPPQNTMPPDLSPHPRYIPLSTSARSPLPSNPEPDRHPQPSNLYPEYNHSSLPTASTSDFHCPPQHDPPTSQSSPGNSSASSRLEVNLGACSVLRFQPREYRSTISNLERACIRRRRQPVQGMDQS